MFFPDVGQQAKSLKGLTRRGQKGDLPGPPPLFPDPEPLAAQADYLFGHIAIAQVVLGLIQLNVPEKKNHQWEAPADQISQRFSSQKDSWQLTNW